MEQMIRWRSGSVFHNLERDEIGEQLSTDHANNNAG